MCTNTRFVHNPHDGYKYLVSCGHCEACLQEKANRHVNRIRSEQLSGTYLGVFVTLSYENQYIPYIKSSEVEAFKNSPLENTISVYRGDFKEIVYDFSDFMVDSSLDVRYLNTDLQYLRSKCRNGRYTRLRDCVGVIQLRDIQLFLKRLRINLVRDNYFSKFSYYYASEYGTKYNRPHFHVLFFIDKGYYERFKLLVRKSWSYADMFKPFRQDDGTYRQSIEVARNPAKYVASYINCRSVIPSFLSYAKPFKPFSHFSNGFGCDYSEFSLPSLLQKIDTGRLRHSYQSVKAGVSTICTARIPKYILSRYFPKFKGYRYLSTDEVFVVALRPARFAEIAAISRRFPKEDIDKVILSLQRLKKRIFPFLKLYSLSYFAWALAYARVWTIFASESILDSYENVKCTNDIWYHYDNIKDYYSGDVRNDFLDSLLLPSHPIGDPNDFPFRQASTARLYVQFEQSVKHHQIKNYYYEEKSIV